MTYTFTQVDTFTIDDTFNRLYADSLDNIKAGTISSEHLSKSDAEIKELVEIRMNISTGYNVIVAKDDVACLYIQGKYENNTYTWLHALVGKIDTSKAWAATTTFHEANKTWIQSLGGTRWAVQCIKGSPIDTYFTSVNSSGICLGSLVTQELENNNKLMTWEY